MSNLPVWPIAESIPERITSLEILRFDISKPRHFSHGTWTSPTRKSWPEDRPSWDGAMEETDGKVSLSEARPGFGLELDEPKLRRLSVGAVTLAAN